MYICKEPGALKHSNDRPDNVLVSRDQLAHLSTIVRSEFCQYLFVQSIVSNITMQGAFDICSIRVQRAWRGYFTRKIVLGRGKFLFRSLFHVARLMSHHDWQLRKGPPLVFLEFALFSSFPCTYLADSWVCRFCRDVSTDLYHSSSVRKPALPKQQLSNTLSTLPNMRLCIDTTVLFQFASEHPVPGSRLQTSLRVPCFSSLSPLQIVVSLQYSIPASRRLLFPSHCAAKIQV